MTDEAKLEALSDGDTFLCCARVTFGEMIRRSTPTESVHVVVADLHGYEVPGEVELRTRLVMQPQDAIMLAVSILRSLPIASIHADVSRPGVSAPVTAH